MENISFGAYMIGVAFWMFIGAVAIAGIVADHLKRRMNVDLLRALIEKGQALDPALVAKVMSTEALDDRTNPLDLKLGGILTTASGVGIFLMSYFVSRLVPVAFYPMLAAGTIAICVGVGLIVGAKALSDARDRERSDQ
jgi:hypothetical protein